MKGLVLAAPERIEFRRDLPEPRLANDHDAIIAVRLAGLCGSDLHPYFGREPVRAGTIPGHECVGTIIDAGDALDRFAPGDLVFAPFSTSCGRCHPCRHELSARCREGDLLGWRPEEGDGGLEGAQAERVRIPFADSTLLRVPVGLTEPAALLLGDNFTTGWYAAESALQYRAFRGENAPVVRSVAVVGCGAVGLSAISALAQMQDGIEIIAVDPIEERRAAAELLGARAFEVASVREACGHRSPRDNGADGVEAVIEAVGSPAAQSLALSLVAPGGSVTAVGVHDAKTFSFSPGDLYDRNLTYRAGRAPVRSILDRLLPEVAAGRVQVPVERLMNEGTVPIAEGADAYRRFAGRENGVRKIAFSME